MRSPLLTSARPGRAIYAPPLFAMRVRTASSWRGHSTKSFNLLSQYLWQVCSEKKTRRGDVLALVAQVHTQTTHAHGEKSNHSFLASSVHVPCVHAQGLWHGLCGRSWGGMNVAGQPVVRGACVFGRRTAARLQHRIDGKWRSQPVVRREFGRRPMARPGWHELG